MCWSVCRDKKKKSKEEGGEDAAEGAEAAENGSGPEEQEEEEDSDDGVSPQAGTRGGGGRGDRLAGRCPGEGGCTVAATGPFMQQRWQSSGDALHCSSQSVLIPLATMPVSCQ
jgi:hypothetical protein